NPAPPSDGLARLRPRAPPAERLASLRASRRYCAPLALRSVLRYAAEMFVDIQALFERQLTYPNPDARDQLNRLVGLDDHKDRLRKILALLVYPRSLARWSEKYHPEANHL